MQLTATVHEAAWKSPLRAAHDVGAEAGPRPLVLVRLEAPDGVIGHGEAAPLESYDGVTVAMVLEALEAYTPLLAAAGTIDPAGHAAVLEACRLRVDLPQALAAVDLALWDLAGHRAGHPVWHWLGATEAPDIPVNAVIGAVDPAAAAGAAAAARVAGFQTVKVKVGTPGDLARVRAVRTVLGADIAIRIDANGAWSTVETALSQLEALASLQIELCEEPVHGAEAIAAVHARSPIPIAVDESVGAELWTERVADAVCLKIATSGITGVLEDARDARAAGYGVFLASTLDGPLGIAAALHAATVVSPDRVCGLATLDRFTSPPPLTVRDGHLAVPTGPGLGDGLLDWYSTLA